MQIKFLDMQIKCDENGSMQSGFVWQFVPVRRGHRDVAAPGTQPLALHTNIVDKNHMHN